MGKGCFEAISLATLSAPRPGAGTDRPALSLHEKVSYSLMKARKPLNVR
jgi:hypothetical protein